jgi:hypothetical protein
MAMTLVDVDGKINISPYICIFLEIFYYYYSHTISLSHYVSLSLETDNSYYLMSYLDRVSNKTENGLFRIFKLD